MRIATVERKTGETQISLTLNLDGTGKCDVKNPIGFFDHMLKSFCKHGLFDLTGSIKGDLEVDQHHLIEDTGIVLGLCFSKALGDCAGIFRSGFFIYLEECGPTYGPHAGQLSSPIRERLRPWPG